jgi:pyruvate/2-oxoacid:ferredoxin oxidoreductase alpha subunit
MTGRIYVGGDEVAGRVACSFSDVIAIYPVTPASPKGEAEMGLCPLGASRERA